MGSSFDSDVMDGPPPDYCYSYRLVEQARQLNEMVKECHGRAVRAGWFTNIETGEPLDRNVPEMLCLIHSEVSEALEGYRKDLNDTHLPNRKMIEVELADTLIRIFDLCGYLKLDVGQSYAEKLCYNATRLDHKLETRKAAGGKKI